MKCWKCGFKIVPGFETYHTYRDRRTGERRTGQSGHCKDCSVADGEVARQFKFIGATDFYDPRRQFQFPYRRWKQKLIQCGYKCLYCGKSARMMIDHIIPMSKGGGLNIENIQPICRSCNASKGDKMPNFKNLYAAQNREILILLFSSRSYNVNDNPRR